METQIIAGIFIGAFLLLSLHYFLLFCFFERNSSILLGAIYVCSLSLFTVSVLDINIKTLVADHVPKMAHKDANLFFLLLSATCLTAYQRSLLRKVLPSSYNKWSTGILAVYTLCTLLFFLVPDWYYAIFNLLLSIGYLAILVVTVKASVLSGKYQRIVFFSLVSLALFGVTSILLVCMEQKILPPGAVYPMLMCLLMQAIVIAPAFSGNAEILKRENEKLTLMALHAAQENERIVRDQNILLEAKVMERTAELKKANDELNTILYDLKEMQAMLIESERAAQTWQVTAVMAHEIGNHLNYVVNATPVIHRNVQELLTQGLSDMVVSETFRMLTLIEKGISRVATMRDIFLRDSFLRPGQKEPARADFDINELLDHAIDFISNTGIQHITFEKVFQAGISPFNCNEHVIGQVFLNILKNAADAIRTKGAEDGHIRVSTTQNDGDIIIVIADNGTGISEEHLKKIFEPFFTTKEIAEGTGLGMTVVMNTIRKYNGTVDIATNLGAGTKVTITLPAT